MTFIPKLNGEIVGRKLSEDMSYIKQVTGGLKFGTIIKTGERHMIVEDQAQQEGGRKKDELIKPVVMHFVVLVNYSITIFGK